ESLREWVADGVNGFLVDPADPEALAQATSRALMDAELRQQAGKINQDLIDDRADRGRVAISAERFYMDILDRVKTGGGDAKGEFQ
ncbi:MAG TPA: glycosyltransferase, partial [Anaerolineales bacterium]|nr:glycosyltransferase [Anaerolineales bacterium]